MVAFGAFVRRTGLLDETGIFQVVEAVTKKRQLLDMNIKAVEAGMRVAREQMAEEDAWAV
jgi:Pyruvate/2-oxoacid:ferredoxin oxidoreductase gamma subunit